jgi:hypothetical protein
MTDLEKQKDEAQSCCQAWQHVFETIEAHLQDRIAMRDEAKPEVYLDIIQHFVARVKRDSEQIVAARWADYARQQQRIDQLEAELAKVT